MAAYVYAIQNKINSRAYIGATTRGHKRWTVEHRPELRRGIHVNGYLQRAWDKYGEDNFEYVILETVQHVRLLTVREQYWMDYYKSLDGVYNFGDAVDSPRRGQHSTEETKAKISKSLMGNTNTLGYKHSDETKQKMSLAAMGNKRALGCKRTDEHRQKMSEAMMGHKNSLGYKHSEETKARLSAANLGNKRALGYKHTEEAKQKISLAGLGRNHSEEAKTKISLASMGNKKWLGRKHTKEAKENMCLAQSIRRQRERDAV